MPTYKIRGIDVDFPFQAYDCQLVYMEKVIQSLQNQTIGMVPECQLELSLTRGIIINQRCNALLESPTGTGKTLCLLCATLAWRKSLGAFSSRKYERRGQNGSTQELDPYSQSQSESSRLPAIVYASRTHSQIKQVINELKRTNYRPKMVVLGSREQLCIHEEVSLLRGRTQTNACHLLCKKRTKRYCAHFSRVAEFVKGNPNLGDEPIDIEDLVNIGRSSSTCPYYISRDLHKSVDILFAPYNYLIDRENRKSLSIEWSNSILIFDEAHNLESLCADAASFDIPSGLLTACISEAKNCVDLSIARREKSSDKSCNPDNFAILRALLLKLEKRIGEVPIDSKELGFTKPGTYMYELLADLNINQKTANMLIDIIEEATLLLEEDASVANNEGLNKSKGSVCRLESMGDILRMIFRDDGNPHAKYYRVHVQEVEGSGPDAFKGKASRTLSWWCFNPGIAMEEFSRLGVASIILTSGTLSPMDSFAEELKLEFPIRLENPHVISENQVWAGVVPAGPSGYPFNSSYRSRDSLQYKLDLGNAIVNLARIVPDGLLVFFPSYYFLDQCIGCWKSTGNGNQTNSSSIWERICKHKLPVVEPRQSSLFPSAIEDYMSKLKDRSASGAAFFAVCRGKVSEGLDFADHAGRAVVITGIPFATRNDPKVRLKREYLDQQTQLQQSISKGLTGEEWYSQQASRAVNQAVGRVIRHKHDYGAIIFCDERFTNPNHQARVSLWIKPHIKCYSKFGDVVFSLTRFFRNGGIHGPTKLEMMRPNARENASQVKDCKPQLDIKISNPLTLPVEQPRSVDSVSSALKAKNCRSSSNLDEIVPANRSSLKSDKLVQNLDMKRSSSLFEFESKFLPSLRKTAQASNHKLIDLTERTLLDKKSDEVIAPCSSKRPRLVITGPDKVCCKSSSENQCCNMLNDDKLTLSGSQDKIEMLPKDEPTLQTKVTSSNDHGKLSGSVTSSEDAENKGSMFLVQVREKLSDVEYKEFVGYLKALKSKAMKIGHVLESVARLFSLPDRLPLLHRFKDYIPAKYRSLYEQYINK
nr:regulator of telomere elongation helicase 1 homolog isoform X2 [Ipomoea batatas]